jgi:hypothetical protein
MNKLSIKQLRWLRRGLTLMFIFLGFIAPILIVCDKINLITEITVEKISWTAIILLISIAYVFKKNILEYINTLEYSLFKSFTLSIAKVSFIIIILGVEILLSMVIKATSLETVQNFIATLDTFRYCVRWWCILSIIAHLGIRPFMDRCTHYIMKETRKDELREVIKE